MKEKRYRLSVDITEDQHMFLNRLSHGWRKQIFSALINMLIDMTNRNGMQILPIIISHELRLEEYFSDNGDR